MDATCNVQDSIHVFHLVHNMCPGFWVHITIEQEAINNFIFVLKAYSSYLMTLVHPVFVTGQAKPY